MMPFFTPRPVEHEVDGRMHNFYPNRTSVLGKLRGFLKPIFRALSTLSATYDTDIGRESVETRGPDGEYQVRTTLKPIEEKLAKQRQEERLATIDYLVENLASPPALRSLALLITDSMRDDFQKKLTDKELDDFIDETPIDALASCLMGVAKASKEVFGPLTNRVEGAISTLKERMASATTQASEQPSEQPVETETTATSG